MYRTYFLIKPYTVIQKHYLSCDF